MVSASPPPSEPTTTQPEAMPSSATIPTGSWYRDGTTKMRWRRISRTTPSPSVGPVKVTQRAIPKLAARAISTSRSSPSPTRVSRVSRPPVLALESAQKLRSTLRILLTR